MPKQSNHTILPHELDARGRIAVWLKNPGRWSWRHPIDAREIVGMGQGSFDAPEGSPPKPDPKAPNGSRLEQIDRVAEEDEMAEVAAAHAASSRPASPSSVQAPGRSGRASSGG